MFSENPVIENDGDAVIFLGADQASDALAQFQNGFRHRIFHEWIAPAFLDGFEPGSGQRVIGNRERQPRNNHIGKRLARHVDPGPETLRTKQHAGDVLAKVANDLMPGFAGALNQQLPPLACAKPLQPTRHILQQLVAGKQYKRAPLGEGEIMRDPFLQSLVKGGRGRFRHGWHQVQSHLLGVVERAADAQGLHFFSTDAVAKIPKILLAHAKRRAGQQTGQAAIEKHGPQRLSHVNGGGAQRERLRQSRRFLHPVDVFFKILVEKLPDTDARFGQTAPGFLQFRFTGAIGHVFTYFDQTFFQSEQGARGRVFDQSGAAHAVFA